ncbi:hypothetical protein MOQ_007154 [Trypanosoma cruzi marinkellei]|uniref:Uncharacterized protein n=1 Tax=Trypanosoma cruzi marinkellei TaxID=85056 RepID=K2MTS3_TRYCR|nr:hypothetical protein MOQ_007154 [Trypanosoma cruzi marinkellei]
MKSKQLPAAGGRRSCTVGMLHLLFDIFPLYLGGGVLVVLADVLCGISHKHTHTHTHTDRNTISLFSISGSLPHLVCTCFSANCFLFLHVTLSYFFFVFLFLVYFSSLSFLPYLAAVADSEGLGNSYLFIYFFLTADTVRRGGLAATAPLHVARQAHAAGRLAVPRPVPSFKPVPFKQEKFLSMKSRTAETYFNTRKHILKRAADVQLQVRKRQQGQSGEEGDACSDRILRGNPLTPHMADEIDAWNRSLKGLEALQGFVLTDELIYGAISKNIRLGAFPYALDWLKKCARERRIPVPTAMLHDVRLFIDFVQSVLPSSNLSLTRAHEALLAGTFVMAGSSGFATNETRAAAPIGSSDAESGEETHAVQLMNSTPYVRYLFKELYIPLWECLVELGLLPLERIHKAETDGEHSLREACHDDMVLDLVSRLCCSPCSDATSFSSCSPSPLSSSSSSHVTSLDGRDNATAAVLKDYTGLLLALVQCAAEAKEVNLLIELQLMFCMLFVEPSIPGESTSGWKLKTTLWCHCQSDEELLCRFANEFIAALYYGRLAYQGEMSLHRHICDSFGIGHDNEDGDDADSSNSKGNNNNNDDDDDDASDDEREGGMNCKEHEGNEDNLSSSLSHGKLRALDSMDVSSSASWSGSRWQKALDDILRNLLQNEVSTLADASVYAALVLEDPALIPKGDNSTGNYRFSKVEIEWMRMHLDICRRCHHGENVVSELEEFFLPGGMVTQGLENSISNVEDQQCFLALVMDTIVGVVAASTAPATERYTLMVRVLTEFLIRMEEVWKKQQKQQNEEAIFLQLPLYSAASAMVLLSPLLRTNSSPERVNRDAMDLNDAAALHKDALRLLHELLRSVLNQPTGFGNAYSVVLMLLTQAEMWEEVLRLLRKLDELGEEGGAAHGISSVILDQRVWAWLFRRARDAGRADICLFLRQRREKLFY